MTHTIRATRLDYADELLGAIALPGGTLRITRGLGSGLSRRAGDPPGTAWAVGDRGPNLKIPFAIERYGLDHLARHADAPGAKVMPFPEIGPAISELRIAEDCVVCVRTIPLRDRGGRPLSGLPVPGRFSEPAFDIAGNALAPDPSGADTEGIAAAADGTFWIADEYGPSLFHVAADGTVLVRWVPQGCAAEFAGADYPVMETLPAIAAHRQLNRGFEALALSADGSRLTLVFQSPLAHPDEEAHARARHVRLWMLDTATGAVIGQFLYRLDRPGQFPARRRDRRCRPCRSEAVRYRGDRARHAAGARTRIGHRQALCRNAGSSQSGRSAPSRRRDTADDRGGKRGGRNPAGTGQDAGLLDRRSSGHRCRSGGVDPALAGHAVAGQRQ
jgi:hypothetical protein